MTTSTTTTQVKSIKVKSIKALDGGVVQITDTDGNISHYRQFASDGTDWSREDKYVKNLSV
jgi:hypothetical protein